MPSEVLVVLQRQQMSMKTTEAAFTCVALHHATSVYMSDRLIRHCTLHSELHKPTQTHGCGCGGCGSSGTGAGTTSRSRHGICKLPISRSRKSSRLLEKKSKNYRGAVLFQRPHQRGSWCRQPWPGGRVFMVISIQPSSHPTCQPYSHSTCQATDYPAI